LRNAVEEWGRLLDTISSKFVKIDTTELWDMGPEEFEEQLPAALRWFESQSQRDFDQLMLLAGLEYDRNTREIVIDDPETVLFQLRGYGWVLPAPWQE